MRKLTTSVPGIYTITHIASGKTYVGQSNNCTKRWQHHKWCLRAQKHRNQPLQRAWNLYGPDAFEFAIAAQPIDPTSAVDIGEMEVAVLRNYPHNYNLMEVGEPRLEASAETKAKLSAERKARWADPEYRARLSASHKAKHADPEWSARRAASIKEALNEPERKAARSDITKAYWAQDGVKEAHAEQRRENWKDPEYREKQSASRKATWEDAEIRERRTDGLKRAWNTDPERREARIQAVKAANSTPEAKARASAHSKALWTPERRAAVSKKRLEMAAAKRAQQRG
jgi:group I intron endonuclease